MLNPKRRKELRTELDIVRKVLRDAGLPDSDDEAIKAALVAHSHFLSTPGVIVTDQSTIESMMLAYAGYVLSEHTGVPHVAVPMEGGGIGFAEAPDAPMPQAPIAH